MVVTFFFIIITFGFDMRVMLKCFKHCASPQDISKSVEINQINQATNAKKTKQKTSYTHSSLANTDTHNPTCLVQ